jgi:hypothetical protein
MTRRSGLRRRSRILARRDARAATRWLGRGVGLSCSRGRQGTRRGACAASIPVRPKWSSLPRPSLVGVRQVSGTRSVGGNQPQSARADAAGSRLDDEREIRERKNNGCVRDPGGIRDDLRGERDPGAKRKAEKARGSGGGSGRHGCARAHPALAEMFQRVRSGIAPRLRCARWAPALGPAGDREFPCPIVSRCPVSGLPVWHRHQEGRRMSAEVDRVGTVVGPTRAAPDAGANGHAGKRRAETTPWSWGALLAPSGGPSRPRSGLWRCAAQRVAAAALSLALGVAGAQEEVPSPPKTLPPLPLPTAAQLERGRALLEKIGYVVANVPLTDAAAVLAVFGFTDLFTKEYPTYIGVGPKGKSGGFSQPRDLVGTGWAAIEVRPRIEKPTGKQVRLVLWASFLGRNLHLDRHGARVSCTARLTGRERAHPRHSPRSSAEGFTYDGTPFREVDTASVLRDGRTLFSLRVPDLRDATLPFPMPFLVRRRFNEHPQSDECRLWQWHQVRGDPVPDYADARSTTSIARRG